MHLALSSITVKRLEEIQRLFGPKVKLCLHPLHRWLLLDRSLDSSDLPFGLPFRTSSTHTTVDCQLWSLRQVPTRELDAALSPRGALELAPKKEREQELDLLHGLAQTWKAECGRLREELRHNFGLDSASYRELERAKAFADHQSRDLLLTKVREQLKAERSETGSELCRLIARRNVEHLVHFTRYGNLYGILKHGLLPHSTRKAMELDTPWLRTDWVRIDGLPEANCLSVTKPNHPMFSRKQADGGDWVVLGFDAAKVLQLPSIFVETNASRGGAFTLAPELLRRRATPTAFEKMFIGDDAGRPFGRKPNETADPQAEVLVFDTIEPSFLSFIALSPNLYSEQQLAIGGVAPRGIEFVSPGSEIHRRMFQQPTNFQY